MLFEPPPPLSPSATAQLTDYSRTMHEFTLRQWTESRRQAAEAAARRMSGGSRSSRSSAGGSSRSGSGSRSGSSPESGEDVPPTVRRRANKTALDDALRREARQHGRRVEPWAC